MVDPQASRFWQAGLQSGLIDAGGLQACWEAIAPEKRTRDQIDRRMARQAVQSGRLTLWQAQQLMAGRSSGFKIDRYVLLDLIGQGGMGRVYLARDSRLNRRVAVKILSPERVNNPRAITRFQREARVGAQLQHENLVRIYDEGESNGKRYLVMEYIEGKNIGAIIAENGRIPPSTAARLTRQVALGLEHAQQKGLIHRDVNPYNILVTREGTAKLTDLGLAIDLGEQIPVTREGATVGTFDYVSPEQARHSHNVDTRSDIYSLGCTLYHMLSGQVPYPTASLPEKLFGHQAAEPEPLEVLVPDLPEELIEVVRKMMRKSPDERYATPMEVAQALESFIGDGSSSSGSALQDVTPSRSATVATRSTMAETKVTAALASNSRPDPTLTPTQGGPGLGPTITRVMPAVERPAAPVAAPAATLATPPAPPVKTVQGASGDELMNMFPSLNLGPEPSLTEGLSRGRKPKSKTSTSSDAVASGPAKGDQTPRPLSPVKVAVAVVVALALVALLVLIIVQKTSTATTSSDKSKSKAQAPAVVTPGDKSQPPTESAAKPAGKNEPEVPKESQFAVRMSDGTVSVETDLKSAMQRAIGSKGHLLLNNTTPLKLNGAEAALPIVGGGRLSIRAAEGVRPVIEVEIKESSPFLTTRTDTPLTLVGVTIVARYAGSAKEPPPLIEAGGAVVLEHCAFKATGAVRGSCAITCQGGGLTATGCWFEGFDKAIDMACFGGSVTTIRQCMMVRAKSDDPPIGWGVRVRSMPGGFAKTGRRLILEQCTMYGKGLLNLVDFSSQAPLSVHVKQCAVLTDALLAWETTPPGNNPLTPEALVWTGQGNQYDIHRKSWVVLSPEGTPELPNGPADLDSWSQQFKESDSLRLPVRFQTDPATISESPQPRDFAVITTGVRSVGANPDQVGPSAKAH